MAILRGGNIVGPWGHPPHLYTQRRKEGTGVSQCNPQSCPAQNPTKEESTCPTPVDVGVDLDGTHCPVFICDLPGPWTDTFLYKYPGGF